MNQQQKSIKNQPSKICDNKGWPKETPNWTIYPWTAGYGYARQNYGLFLAGETDKLEGTIILQDKDNSNNKVNLHFYLTEYDSDGDRDADSNRVCGNSIKGDGSVTGGGEWSKACIKVETICRNSYYGSATFPRIGGHHPDLAGLLVYTIDVVPPNSNGTCD